MCCSKSDGSCCCSWLLQTLTPRVLPLPRAVRVVAGRVAFSPTPSTAAGAGAPQPGSSGRGGHAAEHVGEPGEAPRCSIEHAEAAEPHPAPGWPSSEALPGRRAGAAAPWRKYLLAISLARCFPYRQIKSVPKGLVSCKYQANLSPRCPFACLYSPNCIQLFLPLEHFGASN